MKAPEKIYLYPYSTDGIYEVETKPLEGTVEYTRTDAFAAIFIEKAEGWLREVQKGFILTDKDIVDFVDCMKGE